MTIWEKLAAPLPAESVKCKPGATSGDRAMVIWYVDARTVMDRLDEACGPGNWCDQYDLFDPKDGTVRCRLSICPGDGIPWITKEDVGGESEQKDEGDRTKSAVSDALKRAAVKFGVGRELYRMPQTWAEYDSQKRRFVTKPVYPGSGPIISPDKKVLKLVDELAPETPIRQLPEAWSVVDLRCRGVGLSWETLAKKMGLANPDEITTGHFRGIMERFDKLQGKEKK